MQNGVADGDIQSRLAALAGRARRECAVGGDEPAPRPAARHRGRAHRQRGGAAASRRRLLRMQSGARNAGRRRQQQRRAARAHHDESDRSDDDEQIEEERMGADDDSGCGLPRALVRARRRRRADGAAVRGRR